MKKIFAIVIIGLAFASCKKSSSGLGSNAIQATIGSNTATFNVLTTGYVTDSGKTITLSAYDGTNTITANSISININGDKAITAGTYSDTITTLLPHATSNFSWTEAATIDGNSSYWTSIGLVSSPINITVTSITSTEIMGTFQGPIYLAPQGGFPPVDSTDFQHAVTNGKFAVTLTKKY